MIKISAVIITLNEEQHIGQCLESLQGIADEIVVLDSYSTDQTQAICLRYGARFAQQAFSTYKQQKNDAIALAQYDYILSLDADECLSHELRQSILAIKQNCLFDCYSFNRLNNFCGYWVRYGGWYPDRKMRLFHRDKASWAGGNPHEHLQLQAGASHSILKGDLWHYTVQSIAQFTAQNNHYSTLQAQDMLKNGKKSVTWLHLLLKPMWRFISTYFLKLGCLDGKFGFIIACNAAHAVHLRYAKLLELSKPKM
jgi:glycosyltransferase involved in cell wall biosynthesis